jgi:hypothetical protein
LKKLVLTITQNLLLEYKCLTLWLKFELIFNLINFTKLSSFNITLVRHSSENGCVFYSSSAYDDWCSSKIPHNFFSKIFTLKFRLCTLMGAPLFCAMWRDHSPTLSIRYVIVEFLLLQFGIFFPLWALWFGGVKFWFLAGCQPNATMDTVGLMYLSWIELVNFSTTEICLGFNLLAFCMQSGN